MQITKYAHACFVATVDNQSLIVDPGTWSSDFVMPQNVAGIVITHHHQDHCDSNIINSILKKFPDAQIFAHKSVSVTLGDMPFTAVEAGTAAQLNTFTLRFVGGEHAEIHSSIPRIPNLGVVINNSLYYPGDSFSLPGQPVEILAVPVAAPWMRTADAIDFVRTVKAKEAFPTHDAILSDTGKSLADKLVGDACQSVGTAYRRR